MSSWLKPRLVALFCGAVFLGGATYLNAQSEYGPPAKTPEEAAKNFFKMLELVQYPQTYARFESNQTGLVPLYSSIKRSQFESLQPNEFKGLSTMSKRVDKLFAQPTKPEPVEANTQPSSEGQTVVSLTPPSTQPRKSEVVVVQEDGGYRVDVVATYGRWHRLSGLEADKALYRETGWISPILSTQSEFMRGATLVPCQSNLKQLALGIGMYTQDYDEKLPPARNWASVVQPYIRNEQTFSCPAQSSNSRANGYAYNSRLNRISTESLYSRPQTIQLYETTNPNSGVSASFTGKAYRHTQNGKEGMNISFIDGHVKWYARGTSQRLITDPQMKKAGFLKISGTTP